MRDEQRILRILILHPEAATRRAIDGAIRGAVADPVTVFESESLTGAFLSVRRLDPHCILLDLTEDRALALQVARELRGPARRIIGLYNPLVLRDGEDELFREAARAGVADFVALPAGGDELAAALDAARAGAGGEAAPAEGRLISFLSSKGGVGTTTLAVNAALALAAEGAAGREVVLCDAAIPFGSAAAFLGFVPDRDLADLVADLDDLGAVSPYLYTHPSTGLRVLASPRDLEAAARIGPEEMSQALIALRRRFGIVVVDGGSTIDLLTFSLLDLSEQVFVVTEAVAPALLTTAGLLEMLERQGFGERLRVVVNRHSASDGVLSGPAVDQQLGRPVNYVLREDKAVLAAAGAGVPVVVGRPKSPFAAAVRGLAAEAAAAGAPAALATGGVP